MLAVGWWAGGRSGIHYGRGGHCTIPYPTNNYLLEAAGIYVMNIEEAREYGLQLRAKADDSIIGSAKHVWGEGGVEDIMDWVGVISTYI
jgi:hypothetical protein